MQTAFSDATKHTLKLSAETVIKKQIRQKEAISFREFMEIALYHSEVGYYTSSKSIIENFYTSPYTHPAFGASLSLQLNQMWIAMGEPNVFVVIEVGCGDGILAQDIVGYAKSNRLPFINALEYASSVEAVIIGKPEKEFFNLAIDSLNLKKNEIAMIGDDIMSDIAGAKNNNIFAIQVKTGKYQLQDEKSQYIQPDYRINSIIDLPEVINLY